MNCDYCHEPKTSHDLPSTHVRFHRECEIRLFIGSVVHQQQVCLCYGGTAVEEDYATPREGARAAYKYFTEQAAVRN